MVRLQSISQAIIVWSLVLIFIFCRSSDASAALNMTNGFGQTLIVNTTGCDAQQCAGFYYCYYLTDLNSSSPLQDDLKKLFADNKASRINVNVAPVVNADDDGLKPHNRTLEKPDIVSINGYGYGLHGENMSMVCTTRARVTMEWIPPINVKKDRYHITRDNTGAITRSTLFIAKLDKETDQGDYTCRVTDTKASNSRTLFVEVVENCTIDIQNETEKLSLKSSETATWAIQYRGYPRVSATWKHNGNIISNSPNYKVDNPEKHPSVEFSKTMLKIENLTLEHSGIYELFVSNAKCNVSKNYTLIVTEAPTIPLHDQVLTINRTKEYITLPITGHPASIVTCSYKNCEPPLLDNCTTQQRVPVKTSKSSDILQIANITFEQKSAGVLECEAKNDIMLVRKSAKIHLQTRIDILQIQSVEGIVGYKTQLSCFASINNFSGHAVIERLDKRPVNGCENWSTENYAYNTTITFETVSRNDQGDYICSAKSILNNKTIQRVANLSLLDPVKTNFNGTINPKEENNFYVGNSVTLLCEPDGRPTPSVMWFFKNSEIVANGAYEFSKSKHNLTIKDRDFKYQGKYKCRATGHNNSTVDKLYNVSGGNSDPHWILIIVLTALSVLCVALLIIYRREHFKRVQQKPKKSLIGSLVDGDQESMNPEKTIMEQVDLIPYDKRYDFALKNLKLGKILGSGMFGEVLMGEATGLIAGETRTTVAVKRVKSPPKDEDVISLIKELKIMIFIGKHGNIVNILGVVRENIEKQRQLFVITEFCEFGNLSDYLKKNQPYFVNQIDTSGRINQAIQAIKEQKKKNDSDSNEPIGEDSSGALLNNIKSTLKRKQNTHTETLNPKKVTTTDLVFWSYQVTQGMHYLGTRGVLHGDLAARNVLLCCDEVVKICDFGLSRAMRNDQDYTKESNGIVPIKWLALESFTHRIFNTSTDVWSFGVFMSELFGLGALPYPGLSIDDLVKRLKDGYRMERPKFATQDIYDLMLSCWRLSPPTRPTFAKLASLLADHLSDELRQKVIDQNSEYLEPNYENKFASVHLHCSDGYDNIRIESAKKLSTSPRSCSNTGAPLDNAPTPPSSTLTTMSVIKSMA